MKKIKNLGKKLLKFILKFFSLLWMLLIISNIMRVFYNYIWKFISFMYDLYLEKQVVYADISSSISQDTKYNLQDNIFIQNCDFGEEEGGYGRYMPHINKICIGGTGDIYAVNHELIHYKLRNLSIDKKLLIREKIKKQISNIKNIVNMRDTSELTWDDKTYFEILSWEIAKYAEDPIYKFYDRIEVLALSHRWNEEYITYAVWNLIELDKDNNMYFIKYELTNPLLKEIQDGYLDIYQQLVEIKTQEQETVLSQGKNKDGS